MRRLSSALAFVLVILSPAVGAVAADSAFQIDWSITPATGGPARVYGYVTNTAGWWAQRVYLAVETLDASGHVLGHAMVSVPGAVPPGGRVYFDGTVPTAGPRYRIGVRSYDRLDPGQI